MTTETVEATEQATGIIDRDKLREGLRDCGYPVTEGRYITDAEAAEAKEWLNRVDGSEPPEWVLRMGQSAVVRLQAELMQHRVTVPHQVLATLPEDRAEQLAAWLADAGSDMPPCCWSRSARPTNRSTAGRRKNDGLRTCGAMPPTGPAPASRSTCRRNLSAWPC